LYREETVADCHVRITEIHVQLTLESLLDTQILAKEAATTQCINVMYTEQAYNCREKQNL